MIEKHISASLIQSVLAIEDKRFYKHKGVDIYSLLRAIFRYFFNNRLEGASTITQQLVRNITGDKEIRLKRKMKEIIFAVLVSKKFSKNEILTSYLNTYPFGKYLGISALCMKKKYDITDLSPIQAAEIAAMLKYPTLNRRSYIKYLKRVRIVEIKAKVLS